MAPTEFTDGTRPGCRCGGECEFPCWQRIGTAPACDGCGCAPFDEDPDPADRADALAATADIWPLIAERIPTLADVYAAVSGEWAYSGLEEKFRKGEAEHGRDWLKMTRAQLEAEIAAEWRDLLLYHAMLDARFGPDR